MKPGDLVKITLQNGSKNSPEIIVGTIVSIAPRMPHLEPDPPIQPGPVFDVKILVSDGTVWSSWVDQRDFIEVIS